MSDFYGIRSFLQAHRDELAQDVAGGLAYELDNLGRQWEGEEDKARWWELARDVVGRYPEVVEALQGQGLLPAGWQPGSTSAAANLRVSSPVPARDAPAASRPTTPPPAEEGAAGPPAAAVRDARQAGWERGVALGKEILTGCLGVLIVVVTLAVALVTLSLAGNQEAWARAKDVLLILTGLVGVVLGYYFGRMPGEAQANRAETAAAGARNEAQAARSQLDQTKAEVRGMLTEAAVARTRGASDGEVAISPEQARRLWELVSR